MTEPCLLFQYRNIRTKNRDRVSTLRHRSKFESSRNNCICKLTESRFGLLVQLLNVIKTATFTNDVNEVIACMWSVSA